MLLVVGDRAKRTSKPSVVAVFLCPDNELESFLLITAEERFPPLQGLQNGH